MTCLYTELWRCLNAERSCTPHTDCSNPAVLCGVVVGDVVDVAPNVAKVCPSSSFRSLVSLSPLSSRCNASVCAPALWLDSYVKPPKRRAVLVRIKLNQARFGMFLFFFVFLILISLVTRATSFMIVL